MPRYKLLLEYDGAPFVGWQRQDNGPSVQAAIEDAVFAFCGERTVVHGAGRTDAGVHALGQVAHIDLNREAPAKTVRDALNFHLRPAPIVVLAAEPIDAAFHARFSAIAAALPLSHPQPAEPASTAARALLVAAGAARLPRRCSWREPC